MQLKSGWSAVLYCITTLGFIKLSRSTYQQLFIILLYRNSSLSCLNIFIYKYYYMKYTSCLPTKFSTWSKLYCILCCTSGKIHSTLNIFNLVTSVFREFYFRYFILLFFLMNLNRRIPPLLLFTSPLYLTLCFLI